jgi:Cu/Ag efflux protein CusF
MRRLRLVLLALWLVAAASAQPTPQFLHLSSPAGPGASVPQLVTATDGVVWMSWVEPLAEGGNRLLGAFFNINRTRWSEPREIARGTDWFINWADTPQLAAGSDGRLAAVWFVNHLPSGPSHDHGGYGAWFSLSADAGATWSAPAPLSRESTVNEFVSIVPLPQDRWLAVWLDGRHRQQDPAAAMALYSRVIGEPASDVLLDDRVCDCCATSLAVLPDGSAYVVYRDRSNDEIRDLAGQRWHEGRWSAGPRLPADGWKIEGCPVNGPVLSRAGSRLGLVWFTAAEGTPRVMGTVSTDFAAQWIQPLRLDRANPALGRVGAALQRDGTLWASWLEASGTVMLAPINPRGEVGTAHAIPGTAGGNATRSAGVPRLALVANSAGATAPLLLARTEPAAGEQPSRVTTLLASFPTLATTTSGDPEDCGCDRKGSSVEGHAVRGRIIRLLPERQSVLVAHEDVPGVMPAMTMAFRVDPRLLEFLKPGQQVTGRMARREDGRWWLFNVRIMRETLPDA